MRYLIIFLLLLSPFSFGDWKDSFNKRVKLIGENRCLISIDGKSGALIPFLAAVYNEKGFKTEKVTKHIKSAVTRGCDVNSTDQAGFSALNAGILFNEPGLVRLMLDLGANPQLPISNDSKVFAGLNSFEFINRLISSNKPRPEIEAILKQ